MINNDFFPLGFPPIMQGGEYSAQLIDLLNEKVRRLESENAKKRKEINRLAKQVRQLEKALKEQY